MILGLSDRVLKTTTRFPVSMRELTRLSLQLHSQPQFIPAKDYEAKTAKEKNMGFNTEAGRCKLPRIVFQCSHTGCT